LLLLWGAAVGCGPKSPANHDLDALLASYHQQNAQIERSRERSQERGIERLQVEPPATASGPLVSLDLLDAQLGVVVPRILDHAGVAFVADMPRLRGTVTARFDRRPLLDALRALLEPAGLTADVREGLVAIGPAARAAAPAADVPGAAGTAEVPLSYVRTTRAAEVLNALYPENEDTGLRVVEFASIPETNSVVLSGQRGQVDVAQRLLQDLDRDPGHVMLEALVVEFNTQSFRELGARLDKAAGGRLSFDIANLLGETISFTRVADAAHSTAFRAVLKLLMQRNEARVISRPYVSAVSGSKAHLEVAQDRFVLVTTPGEINVTLQPVSGGVRLDLVPTLTADDSIHLEIAVEQSQFQPTLENVEQLRARSNVSTSVQVLDGQTVIIGGLMLRGQSRSEAGFPIFRNVPLLNALLYHEDAARQDAQVMVFITPYRWSPGMETPMRRTASFELYPARSGGTGEAGGSK
jgi:type II secretory pathway component GspD/PulD (secretin)